MKNKILHIVLLLLLVLQAGAQKHTESKPFRAYLINNEYNLFIRIDLCEESITVPGQELLGKLPGYLGKRNNSYCWLITSADIKDKTASLAMINDFGSEDLTATLTQQNDSIYILQYVDGSTFKIPNKGKWQKLPKKLEFKRSK